MAVRSTNLDETRPAIEIQVKILDLSNLSLESLMLSFDLILESLGDLSLKSLLLTGDFLESLLLSFGDLLKDFIHLLVGRFELSSDEFFDGLNKTSPLVKSLLFSSGFQRNQDEVVLHKWH